SRRLQKGLGGTLPSAAADGPAGIADALPAGPIEIIDARQPQLLTGRDECLRQPCAIRTLRQSKRLVAGGPALDRFEGRPPVRPAPALRAHGLPAVIVLLLAAEIDHSVHRRGAAEHLSPEPGLGRNAVMGLGLKKPDQLGIGIELCRAPWHVDKG